jgi:prepilin peptidase CpaA
MQPIPATPLFLSAIAGFTLAAAVWDLWTRRLPNQLTMAGLVAAIAYHTVSGALEQGLAGAARGLGFALAGFAAGFAILLVLWLIGGGGGGDVKLMAALGAWLGAKLTVYVFVASAIFIAVGLMGLVVWHAAHQGLEHLRGRSSNMSQTKPGNCNPRRVLPFALPLAIGTWVVLAWQVLFLHV